MPIHLSPDDLRRHPQLAAKISEALGKPETAPQPQPPRPSRRYGVQPQGNPRGNRRGNPPRRWWSGWMALPVALALVVAGWYGAEWAAAAAGLTPTPAPTARAQDKAPDKMTDTPRQPDGRKPAPQQPSLAAAGPDKTQDTAPTIRVLVNGQLLAFDVPPQIINGRTLTPLRAIFEALGATVEWRGAYQSIIATRGDTRILLGIGMPKAAVGTKRKGFYPCIEGPFCGPAFDDDGRYEHVYKEVPLDVPATIIDGRTLVPLRFVSEALGAQVDWDGETRTVTITQSVPQVTRKPGPATAPQPPTQAPDKIFTCTYIPAEPFGGTRDAAQCASILEAQGKKIAPPLDPDWTGQVANTWNYYVGALPVWGVKWDEVQTRLVGEEIRVCWPEKGLMNNLIGALVGSGPWSCRAFSLEGKSTGGGNVDSPEKFWGCPPPLQGTLTGVGNRIPLQVQITGPNGSETFRGILDTGAPATILPDSLLRRLGFEPIGEDQPAGGIGSSPAIMRPYRIPYPKVYVDGYGWRALDRGEVIVYGLEKSVMTVPLIGMNTLEAARLEMSGRIWSLSLPCI